MRHRIEAARRDPLTGLPTRAMFDTRADRLLSRGTGAVIVIDLDGFKALNDTHGHAAGDRMIRETGAWLSEWNQGGTRGAVARLGGDEFAAAVRAPGPSYLARELKMLHEWITTPVEHDGLPLAVGASIGAAWHDALTAPDLPALMRRADEAMYAVKTSGGGWDVVCGLTAEQPTVNGRRAGRTGTHLHAGPDGGGLA
jgi:diguanylate cyclase (GGDEF)-like protein